jgi:hypothetical protein
MTAETPRFANKEARQLAAELAQAGFVYLGDDSKGHALYFHAASGIHCPLWTTPRGGQTKRVRYAIAKATGDRRGGFDRTKQRGRIQRASRDADAEAAARRAEADSIGARKEAAARLEARYRELREIQNLMGARGSIF